MTVRPEKVIDSPTLASEKATASCGRQSPPDLLADAEDEEEAVVGAGAEHDHHQQDRREVGDLHADVGRRGDERLGGDEGDGRGEEGHERGQQGPEGEEEQEQDEQDREDLGELLGLAPAGSAGRRPGPRAPVRWTASPGGSPAVAKSWRMSATARHGDRGGRPGGRSRVTTAWRARPSAEAPWSLTSSPGGCRRRRAPPGRWRRCRRPTGGPEAVAATSTASRRRPRPEGCGQRGRPATLGIGGRDELRIAALLDARDPGQAEGQGDGADDPGDDDQPAEADGEASDRGEGERWSTVKMLQPTSGSP